LAIPAVLVGLGWVGRAIGRAALSMPDLTIVGAVDPDPEKAGKTLGQILETAAPDITISEDPGDALRRAKGGVALHATFSHLDRVFRELEQMIKAGVHVVSTCEELAYPWIRYPQLAEKLDDLATRNKVAVLGTGVNPGFVLDRLPATLAQVVGRVERVQGVRIVNAAKRRPPLQKKCGAGLAEADFDRGTEDGTVGHVGLMESAALAALGAGLEVDEVDESIEPVRAKREIAGHSVTVRPGDIAGCRQLARAFHDGREVARLTLELSLGAEDPHDEIEIIGEPPLKLQIAGGIDGDAATVWSVVHAAEVAVEELSPGLRNVLELPAGR
jgi:4-hydroxy-tetrahydrodipicolinate reductase